VKDPEPFNIVVGTSSQLDTLIILALELTCRALCSSTLSQGFLSALIRQVTEIARLVFDHCSSPACYATSDERLILLTRVVAAVAPLHHLHVEFSGPLTSLPYRLLRFQLDTKFSSNDAFVDYSALAGGVVIPAMKVDVCAAVEVLRIENQGDTRQDMRVCHFLCKMFAICILRSTLGSCPVFHPQQHTIRRCRTFASDTRRCIDPRS
jgi:hypothetical protein